MSVILERRLISKDEFEAWKSSPVTQRLMFEINEELQSTRKNNGSAFSSSIQQIAIAYREKAVECALYEDILSWTPDELITSET